MAEIAGTSSARPAAALRQAQASPPRQDQDRTVAAEIAEIREFLKITPEKAGATAHRISEVMARKDLTPQQKQDFVASLIEMASGKSTPYGSADAEFQKAIIGAFEQIGSSSDQNGKVLANSIATVIGNATRPDGTKAARLDASDLHGLFRAPNNVLSDGARSLLTGIKDAKVLSELSRLVLADATNPAAGGGFDINKYQRGPELLVAAADIANMAAERGSPAMAREILRVIDQQMQRGPVTGDMTLVQAMMATTAVGDSYSGAVEGRTGLGVLSKLINVVQPSGATDSRAVTERADRLFATLVRSGQDKYVGGLDQYHDDAAGLNNLGQYFNSNIDRLVTSDFNNRNSKSEDYRSFLTRDFFANVFFDKDFSNRSKSVDAISTAISNKLNIATNGVSSQAAKDDAGAFLGTLIGSMDAGAHDIVARAKNQAESAVAVASIFTDLATNVLVKNPLAATAVGFGLDKLADGYINRAVDEKKQSLQSEALGFKSLFESVFAQMFNSSDSIYREFSTQLDLTAEDRARVPIVY